MGPLPVMNLSYNFACFYLDVKVKVAAFSTAQVIAIDDANAGLLTLEAVFNDVYLPFVFWARLLQELFVDEAVAQVHVLGLELAVVLAVVGTELLMGDQLATFLGGELKVFPLSEGKRIQGAEP